VNDQPLTIYKVTRQGSTWTLNTEDFDVDVEATQPFTRREFHFWSGWTSRSLVIDVPESRSRKIDHCGLVAQIARKQKSGLNFEVTCLGNHGCGIVSRQTTVDYGVEAYQAHVLKYHVPALIPIKESA